MDPKRLLDDVRRVVPEPNYVYDGRAALAGLEAPMHQSMFIANAVWIIVVFVAAVALLNTLTLSVLERRREIGVLRAMGSSRRFTLGWSLPRRQASVSSAASLGLLFGLTDQWLYSLVSGDIMNFDVDFRPSPMALVFTVGAIAISLLGLGATRATRGAAEHHRGSQRRVELPFAARRVITSLPLLTSEMPNRISAVNSSANGSVTGMAIVKFKNGLMERVYCLPGNPYACGPEPQVVLGVSPGSQNIREKRSREDNRNIIVVIGIGS